MNNFGLPERVLADIISVLRKYPEINCAKIFGSRAKGNFKRYSDIDIAIFADKNEQSKLQANVEHDLDDLDAIYNFDVVHYEELENADIRSHIDRVGIIFYVNI